ncbi:hypothetical protein L0337_26820 [candidate division KSB1 bacterium]|nr:hypothetical protein [candidate division KSB1 bacterium]
MIFRKIFKPPIIQEWTALLREKGIKGFLREKGWKVLAAIFVFYLVRDTVIYLLIPFLIAQGFICGK